MEHTELSLATLLCCQVQLALAITTSGINENTSMSKKSASRKEQDEKPIECMRISLHSLMKILVFLYPDDEITVTTLDGLSQTILLAIESSDEAENEGSVVYDLSDGMAYGFSDNWIEALEYVKAGVQEVWFHKMEQEASDCFEGEVVSSDSSPALPEGEGLFSEEAYRREKDLD